MPKTSQVGRLIKPDGTEETIRPAKGGKFTLEELQHAVGGYIELVHFAPRHGLGHYTAYANEDGLGLGLPYNRVASRLYQRGYEEQVGIVGNLLIVTRE